MDYGVKLQVLSPFDLDGVSHFRRGAFNSVPWQIALCDLSGQGPNPGPSSAQIGVWDDRMHE